MARPEHDFPRRIINPERAETDYPQGDGKIDCPLCKGRGVVPIPEEERPAYLLPGTTRYCECVRKRDLMDNLKAGWAPLAKVKSAKNSPLISKTGKSIWLRITDDQLRQHLRAAVLKRSPRWSFKVITDSDLITSWLYSANEVFDADVGASRARGDNTATRITDLVEPYDLTIIRTGFKAARNAATPEVFLEALLSRAHLDKPTWVVDTPSAPLRQGHRAWDEDVQRFLTDHFEFIDMSGPVRPEAQMGGHKPFVPLDMTEVADEPEQEDDGEMFDDNGRLKIKRKNWRK